MIRLAVFTLALSIAAPAVADEPTVTLTQGQLMKIISAEVAKGVAAYVSQEREAEAKDAYAAVRSAFAPKPQPPLPPGGK
jgi:hypothetical protein